MLIVYFVCTDCAHHLTGQLGTGVDFYIREIDEDLYLAVLEAIRK
jgi:hypothetical protein